MSVYLPLAAAAIASEAKPQQFICPACRKVGTWTVGEKPACPVCSSLFMAPLAGTLQVPRYYIFAIITDETMEERYFTMLPGQMPDFCPGSEVKLPLPEGDPLTLRPEWQEAGGWLLITRHSVDFLTGSIFIECHILEADERGTRL